MSTRPIHMISAILAFALLGIIAVTVLGYYDEGTHKLYDGFFDYLRNEAYPPALDYLFWAGLAVTSGFISLLIVEKNKQTASLSPWWKIGISVLAIPLVFLVVVLAFAGIFSIISGGG